MNVKIAHTLCVTAIVISGPGLAIGAPKLTTVAPRGIWESIDELPTPVGTQTIGIQPNVYRAVLLDHVSLASQLSEAPGEFDDGAMETAGRIQLPMPDGTLSAFRYWESPIMHPALAAKFPDIRTFVGRGIDDRSASVRFDMTPAGFHAQILSPNGAVYIDPLFKGNLQRYATYFKRDYAPQGKPFGCQVHDEMDGTGATAAATSLSTGDELRVYRLACAATGEYTNFHGGTVPLAMAAIVTAINRVTGVYEVELGVRMELIANNDDIIYTDSGTDPYANSNGFAMLGQNQDTLDAVIGTANYDFGHVFSTGGGGVAGLGVICDSGLKAWGVTGLPNPIGDPFYIDFVAHEMGHQFGGHHTFNGVRLSCNGNRTSSTAFEPGSGSTIQAYAGICGADDLQAHSDPYFHSVSLEEMIAHTRTGGGSVCPSILNTGNTPPTVDAGLSFVIPSRTPFALSASGNDFDGDSLTYNWEERDLGPAKTLNAADDGNIPLFRSYNASSNPTRTFPRLSDLLVNASSSAEKLPIVSRVMDFLVAVRDNNPAGGGVATDTMQLTIDPNSGPFRVTSPNTPISLEGALNVAWDVANTDLSPVSAATVDILLSTDGGLTYPTVLAASTPNDGAETVMLPGISAPQSRIRVQGSGNVFFDISDSDFAVGFCPPVAPQADVSAVTRSRYLRFRPGASGTNAAVRITLTQAPPGFEALENTVMWAGPTQKITELSGQTSETPEPSFTRANAQCSVHCQDWSITDVVELYGAAVIPGASYRIQTVGCGCDMGSEASFSIGLDLETGDWADVGGNPDGTPPDDIVDFIDIQNLVAKFKNLDGAIAKARADLSPETPDGLIDFFDIQRTLEVFSGGGYPFSPSGCP